MGESACTVWYPLLNIEKSAPERMLPLIALSLSHTQVKTHKKKKQIAASAARNDGKHKLE